MVALPAEPDLDSEHSLQPPKTDKPWLFKPGQSGNPGGRPAGETVRSIIVRLTTENAAALVNKLIKMGLSDHREARQAAEYLLNQVAGAPRQLVRLESDEANPALLAMQAVAAALYAANDSVLQSAADQANSSAIEGSARLIDEPPSQDS